jgi:hypothetical protein
MQSAAEAECGGLYITLEELGHPQPATPIRTDNNRSQWTCDFTGYRIESNRDNLESFGHQAK